MSNIFNSVARYFGTKERPYNPEAYQPRQQSEKGLMVLGYSVVYFDTKSQSRSRNYENL